MSDFEDFLNKLKAENPELKEFAEKIPKYFTEQGFNTAQFESALDKRLKQFENEVIDQFKQPN